MQNIYCIEMENGEKYDVIDRITDQKTIYFYLVQSDDYQNMVIQKSLINSQKNELCGITDPQEFQYALSLFQAKHPVTSF